MTVIDCRSWQRNVTNINKFSSQVFASIVFLEPMEIPDSIHIENIDAIES